MTAAFMLDTDTVSYAFRGLGAVGATLQRHRPSQLCVSVVTVAELRYGASRRKSVRLHRLIDVFTRDIAVMPFDEACASQFGEIGADLAGRGSPIGELDVMIAAHAMTLDVTLVTNNVKHFTRVPGLRVVNWA